MLKNSELDIDGRFVEAVLFLEKNGKIHSRGELSEMLGYSKQSLSEVLSGRTKTNIYKIRKFCTHYKINLQWVVFGIGEIDQSNEEQAKYTIKNEGINLEINGSKIDSLNNYTLKDCARENDFLNKEIEHLKKELELKDKIISLLESK